MSVEVTSVSVSLPQRWQRNDSIWHTECMRGGCDLWEYWWPSHHKSSTVTERRRASPKECDGANSSETSLSVTTHHRGHNYHFWFTFSFIKEERNCQECVCVCISFPYICIWRLHSGFIILIVNHFHEMTKSNNMLVDLSTLDDFIPSQCFQLRACWFLL